MKIMNVQEIKEDYIIRNLHREAKLLAQLSHPCIAALYETMQVSDFLDPRHTVLFALFHSLKMGRVNETLGVFSCVCVCALVLCFRAAPCITW